MEMVKGATKGKAGNSAWESKSKDSWGSQTDSDQSWKRKQSDSSDWKKSSWSDRDDASWSGGAGRSAQAATSSYRQGGGVKKLKAGPRNTSATQPASSNASLDQQLDDY